MLVNLACTTGPCKTQRPARRAGVTLVEMLVSIGIGTLVALAIISFSLYTGKGFAGVMNYVDLENQSRSALDRMIKDIRGSKYLRQHSTNQLTFVDFDDQLLVYEYSPETRELLRKKDGTSEVFLRECDRLSFEVFYRNTMSGTFDQYSSLSAPTNTKVVQLSWVCSRTITGSRINTESVQTAKINIRNK